MNNSVRSLVLTGGPGAGKSTVLALLQKELTSLGFTVFSVPEVARSLYISGVRGAPGVLEEADFQRAVLGLTLTLEDHYRELAEKVASKGKQIVLLHDRGALDGFSYTSERIFHQLVEGVGLSLRDLAGRYDGVIYLQSPAANSETAGFYVIDKERGEDAVTAGQLDAVTREIWKKVFPPHRFLSVCASQDFDAKCRAALVAARSLLGISDS